MPELINTVPPCDRKDGQVTISCQLRPAFCATPRRQRDVATGWLAADASASRAGPPALCAGPPSRDCGDAPRGSKKFRNGGVTGDRLQLSQSVHASRVVARVAVDGSRTWFDTNVSEHHHFLLEDDNQIIDIPDSSIAINGIDEIPEGMEIARVEVIVRLRRKASK